MARGDKRKCSSLLDGRKCKRAAVCRGVCGRHYCQINSKIRWGHLSITDAVKQGLFEGCQISERKKREYIPSSPLRVRAGILLTSARKRAEDRGLPFSLNKEDIVRRFEAGVCEVTGIKFDLSLPGRFRRFCRGPWVPSVDRVDPLKGYTPENTKVVVWAYNVAKSDFKNSDVMTLAKALVASESS